MFRLGSSPHTWGKHLANGSIADNLRFIPTYVGQTKSLSPASLSPIGSSPHTWGKRFRLGWERSGARFIPTYVGQTLHQLTDNPPQFGSSPHTWGKRLVRLASFCQTSVHPHIRGANVEDVDAPVVLDRFIPTYVGQTPSPGRPPRPSPRFIPTCVGQTHCR